MRIRIRLIAGLLLFAAAALMSARLPAVSPVWWHGMVWLGLLFFLHNPVDHSRSWKATILPYVLAGLVWFVFEAANLILHQWYFIAFPVHPAGRALGVGILAAPMVAAVTFGTHAPETRVTPVDPFPSVLPVGLGVIFIVVTLVSPRFTPLFWLAPSFLCHPFLAARQRAGGRAQTVLGDPRLLFRLTVSGLAAALVGAGLADWFGEVRIATGNPTWPGSQGNAPPFGWIGFPFAMVSAFSLFQLAKSLEDSIRRLRKTFLVNLATSCVILVTSIFALLLFLSMDHRVISSFTSSLTHLPGQEAIGSEWGNIDDVREVVEIGPIGVQEETGLDPGTALELWHAADLTLLRGIGTEHVRQLKRMGIHRTCDFAEYTGEEIWMTIHALFKGLGPRPTLSEVRIWKRAASERCAQLDNPS